MKVLLVNTYDSGGGAAITAYRYMQALAYSGAEVKMLVKHKGRTDSNIFTAGNGFINLLLSRLDKYYLKLRGYQPNGAFSVNKRGLHITQHPLVKWADIIHLHWCNRGFLSIEEIGALHRTGKKIVWTLHDSWAFTGGCHLPYTCKKYEDKCGACPVLGSERHNDLSSEIWNLKSKHWHDLQMQLICPSSWMTSSVQKSSLLKNKQVTTIANPVNTAVFSPRDKIAARKEFGIPEGKKAILFGAFSATTDKNKGLDLLTEALYKMTAEEQQKAVIIVFGTESFPAFEGFETISAGIIREEQKLSRLFSAADVYILPSRSESFSNTTAESLCSGTPVVIFDNGGTTDLIIHRRNGYIAEPFSTDDLLEGIRTALRGPGLMSSDEIAAAAKSRYGYDTFSKQLSALYGAL